MNEKNSKICLVSFNVLVLMAGVAMLVGGLLLEYLPVTSSILKTLNTNVTASQIGAIGVAMIVVGAFIIMISIVGCCGALSESRCLLTIYFGIILLLLLCQFGIAIASFVFGTAEFIELINSQLIPLVNGYGTGGNDDGLVDTIQQFFQCCGYNGTNDYENYIPPSQDNLDNIGTTGAPNKVTNAIVTTVENEMSNETFFTGFWPESCCKPDVVVEICTNNTLPVSTLENYLNTEGCTMKIDEWVQTHLLIIGGVAAGIALIELICLIMACSLRNALD